MTPDDLDHCTRIALRMCHDRTSSVDEDDMISDAAWGFYTDHYGDPYRNAWREVIVGLRRRRPGTRRRPVTVLPFEDKHDRGRCDDEPFDVSVYPMHRDLLMLLALGFSKREASEMLGVSASRVSQRLAEVRAAS